MGDAATQPHPVFEATVLVIAGWETLSLSTGLVPAVSTAVRAIPPIPRALLLVAVGIVLTDHFYWRHFT